MRKQTIENHTQDKRLKVLFRKFRKMWRVAENRRKMKFRSASENVDNIIVWMRMVESKSQQKIKQKGSARNWTEVIRFKVSYDNQLHHRTFPFFHFSLIYSHESFEDEFEMTLKQKETVTGDRTRNCGMKIHCVNHLHHNGLLSFSLLVALVFFIWCLYHHIDSFVLFSVWFLVIILES